MKIKNFLAVAITALSLAACTSETYEPELPKPGAYENGILISNEGGFSTPNADVTFIDYNLTTVKQKIYSATNNENLGNVFQAIGLKNNEAYLVLNVPNKINIVDRYTFVKKSTITDQLDNPRYIAFGNDGSAYVTNNDFASVHKLNVYNPANTFVKSISFDRYAEKVVSAEGKIIVQTDGGNYTASGFVPSGHTITIVNGSSNNVEKVITLPDSGIIRDLIYAESGVYVLSSSSTASYIYTIAPSTGTYTTTTLSGLGNLERMRRASGVFYLADSTNKIYKMPASSTTVPTAPLLTAPGYLYGMDVINGKLFVANANFTGDSSMNIYNIDNGALLKTITTGVGTNGAYAN